MRFQRFDDCDDAYSQAPGGVRFVESHIDMNYEFLEAALVRERTRQFRLMILVSGDSAWCWAVLAAQRLIVVAPATVAGERSLRIHLASSQRPSQPRGWFPKRGAVCFRAFS